MKDCQNLRFQEAGSQSGMRRGCDKVVFATSSKLLMLTEKIKDRVLVASHCTKLVLLDFALLKEQINFEIGAKSDLRCVCLTRGSRKCTVSSQGSIWQRFCRRVHRYPSKVPGLDTFEETELLKEIILNLSRFR